MAAGPQTQMAQNIVTAWLAGARLIELKTIQTLDELEVNKPCIDVTDEGYNVEWSQELKIHQSFDEYLRAWVLVHALHRALGFPGERPGVIFNMSVGYDLAGVQRPNVTWYLDAMADASAWLPAYVDIVARRFPAVREIDIPARLSDTVTLSTMHGCPPDEIERISRYLIDERGLHTLGEVQPHAARARSACAASSTRTWAGRTCPSRTRPSVTTCATRTRCPCSGGCGRPPTSAASSSG